MFQHQQGDLKQKGWKRHKMSMEKKNSTPARMSDPLTQVNSDAKQGDNTSKTKKEGREDDKK